MARIAYLSLEDFKTICEELQTFFKKHNDPIPIYNQSYFDKLDSQPIIMSRDTVFGRALAAKKHYRTPVLFYSK